VRISNQTQLTIQEAVAEIFGSEAVVSLFGSRVNDELKGGDIDLLVQSEQMVQNRQQKICQLVARLQIRLGDQPIDVVVIDPAVQRKAIHEEALRTGLKL